MSDLAVIQSCRLQNL